MKCDCCGHPATIQEVTMRHGKRVERRLCEQCAAAAGMVPPSAPSVSELLSQLLSPAPPNMQPLPPASSGKGGKGGQDGSSPSGKVPKKGDLEAGAGAAGGLTGVPFGIGMPMDAHLSRCPRCSATMGQLRDSGLLGCPTCYEAFLPQLLPLLQRYHEGGGCHRGKVPKRQASGEPPRIASKSKRKAKLAVDPMVLARQVEKLRASLSAALAEEDYRAAALIRDELIKLGQGQTSGPMTGGGSAL